MQSKRQVAFFEASQKKSKHKDAVKCNFINVGGEQFHACAVAIIDNVKSTTLKSSEFLKPLLDAYSLYFPQTLANQAYLSSVERMNMLINGLRMTDLVQSLAFVLRQIAVDEIYANPTQYFEVFQNISPSTSKGYLRQPNIALAANTLSALTEALGITIILSYVEHGKELRKREIYQKTSEALTISLQVQGDHYFPEVKNPKTFTYVGHLRSYLKSDAIKENGETVKNCLDIIALEGKRLSNSYHQTYKSLVSMLVAKEISQANLLELFIELYPLKNTTSSGQRYLSTLAQRQMKPVSMALSKDLLADTLAIWVAASQVDADELFERLEKKSGKKYTSGL